MKSQVGDPVHSIRSALQKFRTQRHAPVMELVSQDMPDVEVANLLLGRSLRQC
jgi:hypothetical protein